MPPAIVTRHLAKMLANRHLNVSVVSGAVTTYGLFDDEHTLVSDGVNEVREERRSVLVRAGSLPGTVRQNSVLTVDGRSYKVRAVLPQDDGQTTRYVLAVSHDC
jgi:hypothetical protein